MPKFKKVFFIKNPEQLLIIQFYYTNFLPRIGQIKMNVVTFLYSKQIKNAESYFDKSDSAFGLSIGIAAYHIGSLSHQFISTLRHQFISTLSH